MIGQDYAAIAAHHKRRALKFLLELLLFDNGFQAVVLYRVAARAKRMRLPGVAPLVARLNVLLTGVDINPRAQIGPGLMISHGVGLVIGGDVVVGERVLLHHGVTLGAPTVGRIDQCPRIGSDVTVGAGSAILGAIEVGDGSFVGAGVVLTESVQAGSLVTVQQTLDVRTRDPEPPKA